MGPGRRKGVITGSIGSNILCRNVHIVPRQNRKVMFSEASVSHSVHKGVCKVSLVPCPFQAVRYLGGRLWEVGYTGVGYLGG